MKTERQTPDPSLKGIKGGNCNRTACQGPDAYWFNHSTRKYYCTDCGLMLNEVNHRDAMRLFGHALCTDERIKSRRLKSDNHTEADSIMGNVTTKIFMKSEDQKK